MSTSRIKTFFNGISSFILGAGFGAFLGKALYSLQSQSFTYNGPEQPYFIALHAAPMAVLMAMYTSLSSSSRNNIISIKISEAMMTGLSAAVVITALVELFWDVGAVAGFTHRDFDKDANGCFTSGSERPVCAPYICDNSTLAILYNRQAKEICLKVAEQALKYAVPPIYCTSLSAASWLGYRRGQRQANLLFPDVKKASDAKRVQLEEIKIKSFSKEEEKDSSLLTPRRVLT